MKRTFDLHTHILYGVDDGARTMKESLALLEEAGEQGITDIVLTPHYRKGMFAYPTEDILKHFLLLKKAARPLNISLYLGCEYHVNETMIEYLRKNRCFPLNLGDHVLAEYKPLTEYDFIRYYTQELLQSGYTPLIAHVERYECLTADPDRIAQLSEMGALIQINADSVLGMTGRQIRKFCHGLLKNGWVDIVASDVHNQTDRANHLMECRAYIEKKYGKAYAADLFDRNARHILHIDTKESRGE